MREEAKREGIVGERRSKGVENRGQRKKRGDLEDERRKVKESGVELGGEWWREGERKGAEGCMRRRTVRRVERGGGGTLLWPPVLHVRFGELLEL